MVHQRVIPVLSSRAETRFETLYSPTYTKKRPISMCTRGAHMESVTHMTCRRLRSHGSVEYTARDIHQAIYQSFQPTAGPVIADLHQTQQQHTAPRIKRARVPWHCTNSIGNDRNLSTPYDPNSQSTKAAKELITRRQAGRHSSHSRLSAAALSN